MPRGDDHEYQLCDDAHCERFPCKVYKEGYEDGYQSGSAAGYAAGFGDGYAEGFDAGAASVPEG